MEENELIINKYINLDKIKNQKDYTKLVIYTKFNPKKLSGFTNIKEIVLDGLTSKIRATNEKNLNLLPIKDNVEKIRFINTSTLGSYSHNFSATTEFYNLLYPNLKSIEFPKRINYIYKNYVKNLLNLEEIIFNCSRSYSNFDKILIDSKKFKRIAIKFNSIIYTVNLDYDINKITNIKYSYTEKIEVSYGNDDVSSTATIDLKTGNIKYSNRLICANINNNILYIPDYITDINEQYKPVKEVNFNLKLLDSINNRNFVIIYSDYNKNIEKIVLRDNNSMLLLPEKVINVREYGSLNCFYIENNLLVLEYNDFKLSINSKGNIQKNITKPKEKPKEIDLNKLNEKELREYMSCKVLLELIKENDIEYKKAMEVVENRVIKRLTK